MHHRLDDRLPTPLPAHTPWVPAGRRGKSCCWKDNTNAFYKDRFLLPKGKENLSLPGVLRGEQLLGEFKSQDVRLTRLGTPCCMAYDLSSMTSVGVLVTSQRIVIVEDVQGRDHFVGGRHHRPLGLHQQQVAVEEAPLGDPGDA